MDQTQTIKLDKPVTEGNEVIAQLTIREPQVRDRLATKSTGDKEVEEIALIAHLAGVPVSIIEKLTMKDYGKAQRALASFL